MEKQNQHYIPQYYFRKFSNTKNHICMILKRTGQIIKNAKISTQASKNNFYGDMNIEKKITKYDTEYSKILSDIIKKINTRKITNQDATKIKEAICFQELRTSTYRKLQKPLMSFNEDFLKPQIEDLDNYDSGVSSEATEAIRTVMKKVLSEFSNGSQRQLYEMFNTEKELNEISDLNTIFIKNKTDIPFILVIIQ